MTPDELTAENEKLRAEVKRLTEMVNELNEERRADRLALLGCLDGGRVVYELHEEDKLRDVA